jgi:hypothetical protein
MRILSIFTLDPASFTPPSQEKIERMGTLIEDLRKKGNLIETGGAMDGMLELKYTKKNGKTTVVDGPFAESKEVVGGFALLEVSGRDEALELTRQFLDVAGEGTCFLHEVSVA